MCITFLENESKAEDEVLFNGDYILNINKDLNNTNKSMSFLNINSQEIQNNFNLLEYNNVLDFRSDTSIKLLLFFPSGPYHLVFNFLNKIITIKEKYKNIKLYINTSFYELIEEKTDFDINFYNFLFNFLQDNNIEYKIFNSFHDIDYIVLNNFILYNQSYGINSTPLTHNLFIKYFKQYIKNIEQKPYKKVYLNRKNYENRKIYETKLSINQDNRINNENVFEQYLLENNFESISLENYFNTFEDHLNYFYSVKTLIAVTSAGLTNCIYMQENTKLVELVTPQVVEFYNDSGQYLGITLHSLWQPITSSKNIDHISISNYSRNAEDIVKKIKTTKYLQEIIKE